MLITINKNEAFINAFETEYLFFKLYFYLYYHKTDNKFINRFLKLDRGKITTINPLTQFYFYNITSHCDV